MNKKIEDALNNAIQAAHDEGNVALEAILNTIAGVHCMGMEKELWKHTNDFNEKMIALVHEIKSAQN